MTNWNEPGKNVLVYFNECLYAREHKKVFELDDSVNVEHIMPASGHNIETIRVDAGIEDKTEFSDLVNSLGNKILLEEDINKSISSDWFKTKKGNTVQSRKGYCKSKFALATALANYPRDTWGKEDITIATEKAINRLVHFILNK